VSVNFSDFTVLYKTIDYMEGWMRMGSMYVLI